MQYLISDDTRERHYKIHSFVIKKQVVQEGAWFVVPAHAHVRQAASFSLVSLDFISKVSDFASVGQWCFVLIQFCYAFFIIHPIIKDK